MAEDVVISFVAETEGLQRTIDLLEKLGQVDKKTADEFRKATETYKQGLSNVAVGATTGFKKLDTAIKDVGKSISTAIVLDKSKDVEKTTKAVVSLREQIRQATQDLVSARERFGELSPEALKAAENVAKLRSEFTNVQKQISALDPQAKFNAFLQLGTGISGAFTAATGALALFGSESEATEKALLKVQAALAVTQGLNSVLQLKDGYVALRSILGLTTAATTTQAVASEVLTGANATQAVAAEGATVATKAFSAALLTNPIFLAVAAITTLAGAFVLLSDDVNEGEEALKDFDDALKALDTTIEKRSQRNKNITDELDTQLALQKLQGKGSIADLNAEIGLRETKIQLIKDETDELRKQGSADLTKALKQLNIDRRGDIISEKEYLEKKKELDAKRIELQNKIDASPKQIEDIQNEIRILYASFDKAENDRIVEETKKKQALYVERNKIKRDLEFEISALSISLIQDETEKKLAELDLQQAREIDKYNKLFKEKKITLEQLADIDIAIAKETSEKKSAILAARDEKDLKDEKDRTEKNLAEILATIQGGTDKKIAQEAEALNAGIQEKERLLRASGLSELEIYRELNKFIEDEVSRSADKRNQLELSSLKLKKAELEAAGKSTVDIAKQIADKELEITKKGIKEKGDAVAKGNEEALTNLEDFFEKLQQVSELSSALLDFGAAVSERNIEAIEEEKNARLAAIDEQVAALQTSRDNELISQAAFENQKKQLLKQREQAEKAAQKRINEEKRKQDIANRAQKIFEISIATAKNIVEAGLNPVLIALAAAIGAAQLATVLATPLPKYHTGKRAKHMRGEHMAVIRDDEDIFSPETSRDFAPTFKAIHDKKIKPIDLNNFVGMRSGRLSQSFSNNIKASLDLDYDLLASKIGSELSWQMRGNKDVRVKNIKDLADAINSNYDIRRA